MNRLYSWAWVEAQVAETAAAWNGCSGGQVPDAPRYSPREQRRREQAYDEGLEAVEHELKKARRSRGTGSRAKSRSA